MSELTTAKTVAGDERPSLFKEAERLKVEKAALEARTARLEQEVIELKGQRGDVKPKAPKCSRKSWPSLRRNGILSTMRLNRLRLT